MDSTESTWPSTSTIMSRNMLCATSPLLMSSLWRPALTVESRRVKDGKSIRTSSAISSSPNNLAASNATADSRANEIMDPRKEDSDKVVNTTKPETDAKHDPDHKVLVVMIQFITLVPSRSTCLPVPHGCFSLTQRPWQRYCLSQSHILRWMRR
jgi:hypothetical protein